MKKKWIGKTLCIVLAAVMLLSLAACGGGGSRPQNSDKPAGNAAEPPKQDNTQTSNTTPPKQEDPQNGNTAEPPQGSGNEADEKPGDDDEVWDDEDPNASVKPYEAPVRPLDNGERVKAGDIVTFGSYPQSSSGGAAPIEWIVLDVQEGKALLLSRYVLDAMKYHGTYATVTWEKCDLRNWLNTVFLNAAFDGVRDRLIPSLSTADKTPGLEKPGDPGNNVTDTVFLLSATDVVNTKFGFIEDLNYGRQDPIRMARPTDYAVSRGVEPAASGPDAGNAEWWLRSTGSNGGKNAVYIYFDSFVCTYGGYVIHSYGVRPSVWVSLK